MPSLAWLHWLWACLPLPVMATEVILPLGLCGLSDPLAGSPFSFLPLTLPRSHPTFQGRLCESCQRGAGQRNGGERSFQPSPSLPPPPARLSAEQTGSQEWGGGGAQSLAVTVTSPLWPRSALLPVTQPLRGPLDLPISSLEPLGAPGLRLWPAGPSLRRGQVAPLPFSPVRMSKPKLSRVTARVEENPRLPPPRPRDHVSCSRSGAGPVPPAHACGEQVGSP